MSISQSYFVELIIIDKQEEIIAISTDSVSADDSVNRLAFKNSTRAIQSPARDTPKFIAAQFDKVESLSAISKYSGESIKNPHYYADIKQFSLSNVIDEREVYQSQALQCTNSIIPYPNWIQDSIKFSLDLRNAILSQSVYPKAPSIPWKTVQGTTIGLLDSGILLLAYNPSMSSIPLESIKTNAVLFNGYSNVLDSYKDSLSYYSSGLTSNTIVVDIPVTIGKDYSFIIDIEWYVSGDRDKILTTGLYLKSAKLIYGVEGIKQSLIEIFSQNESSKYIMTVNVGDKSTIRLYLISVLGRFFKLNDITFCEKPELVEAKCDVGTTNQVKNSSFLTGVNNWQGYGSSGYYDLTLSSWSSELYGVILAKDGCLEIRQKITGLNKQSSLYLSFDVLKYDPDYPEATLEYGAIYNVQRNSDGTLRSSIQVFSGKPKNVKVSLPPSRFDGTVELYFRLGKVGDKIILSNILLCSTNLSATQSLPQVLSNVNIGGNTYIQPVVNCGTNYKTISYNPSADQITDWSGVVYNNAELCYPMGVLNKLERTYDGLTFGDTFLLTMQVMDVGIVVVTLIVDEKEVVREFNTIGLGVAEEPLLMPALSSDKTILARAGMVFTSYTVPKSGTITVRIRAYLDSRGAVRIPAPPAPLPYTDSRFEKVKNGLFITGVNDWYVYEDPYPSNLWVSKILNNGRTHGGLYLFNPAPISGYRENYEIAVYATQMIEGLIPGDYYIFSFRADAPNVNAIGRGTVSIRNGMVGSVKNYPLYNSSTADENNRYKSDQIEIGLSNTKSTVYHAAVFGPIDASGRAFIFFSNSTPYELRNSAYGMVISEVSIIPSILDYNATAFDITDITGVTDFDPLLDGYPFRIRALRACTFTPADAKVLCGDGYDLISFDDFTTGGGGWVLRDYVTNQLLTADYTNNKMSINKNQMLVKLYSSLSPKKNFKLSFDKLNGNYLTVNLLASDNTVITSKMIAPQVSRYEIIGNVPSDGAITVMVSNSNSEYARVVSDTNPRKSKVDETQSVAVPTGIGAPSSAYRIITNLITEVDYIYFNPYVVQEIEFDNQLTWIYNFDPLRRTIETVKIIVELVIGTKAYTLITLDPNQTVGLDVNDEPKRNDFVLTSNGKVKLYVNPTCNPECVPSHLTSYPPANINPSNSSIVLPEFRTGDSEYYVYSQIMESGPCTLRLTKRIITWPVFTTEYGRRTQTGYNLNDINNFTTYSDVTMKGLSIPQVTDITNITACTTQIDVVNTTNQSGANIGGALRSMPSFATTIKCIFKFNGTPRLPINLFNMFLKVTTRSLSTPYPKTVTNIKPSGESHLGVSFDSVCNFWKQNGNGGLIETNILSYNLSNLESIKVNDFKIVKDRVNYLWSIPTNSSKATSDQLIVEFELPAIDGVIESVEPYFLMNKVNGPAKNRFYLVSKANAYDPDIRYPGGYLSTDGINWTKSSLSAELVWDRAATNGSMILIIGKALNDQNGFSPTSKYYYSYNGLDWVAGDLPQAGYGGTIVWSNGKFVLFTGSQGDGAYYTSADGISWDINVAPKKPTYYAGYVEPFPTGLMSINNRVIAVDSTEEYLAWSSDGVQWNVLFIGKDINASNQPGYQASVGLTYHGAYLNGLYVIPYYDYDWSGGVSVAYSRLAVLLIDDTFTNVQRVVITPISNASVPNGPDLHNFTNIINVNNILYLGTNLGIYRSTDGRNWDFVKFKESCDVYNLNYVNGKFVATGAFNTFTATSDDGINWTINKETGLKNGQMFINSLSIPGQKASVISVCTPDPATSLDIGIEYILNDKKKQFSQTVQIKDIYSQEEEIENWDTMSATGNGVGSKIAQWVSASFILDSLGGNGIDQITAPIISNHTGTAKLNIRLSPVNECA